MGRRTGLKIPRAERPVPVRLRPPAPDPMRAHEQRDRQKRPPTSSSSWATRSATATLLERALTHKSFSNENREVRAPNNERLEFLGDAVLGFVIGEMIYRSFPNLQEGALSKIKAHLVSATMLSTKARVLEIGRFLQDGRGGGPLRAAPRSSRCSPTPSRPSWPRSTSTAGCPPSRRSSAASSSRRSRSSTSATSPSTTTRRRSRRPRRAWAFRCRSTASSTSPGPDHEKAFVVELALGRRVLRAGEADPSKREAQRKAAKEALKRLGRIPA